MVGKKRKAQDMDFMTKEELAMRINKIDNARDRALIATLYLSGARISEVLGTRKSKKNVRGLIREDVKILRDEDLIIIYNVACLKRRDSLPRRNIPIVISREREIVSHLIEHVQSLRAGEPLFSITRQRAWQIIKKHLGVFNHFLIHERCTHLVTDYNFTDQDLRQFRGWANTLPASVYSLLRYQDLASKMGSNSRQ